MIVILRLGHRVARDKRLTTHVALIGRAFGADKIMVSTKDARLETTVRGVVEKFGGNFEIQTGVNWRTYIKDWLKRGIVVHLTMYGLPINEVMPKLKSLEKDILIVVGAEKVPAEVYKIANYNIAVGNQPHSEAAALAIFLDRYLDGKWQRINFKGRYEIVPSDRKKLLRRVV